MEVIYYVAASLDGFIATPDGGVEWLSPFEGTGEDYGYAEFYASVDVLLMGSRTYEQSLGFGKWPFEGKPSLVLSKRPLRPARADVTVSADPPARVVSELQALGYRKAWLVGGAAVAGSMRTEGLITGYVVSLIPVVLGGGVPLFGQPGPRERLTLTSTRSFPNGLVQVSYARGEPALR